jgi:hypothetical protein
MDETGLSTVPNITTKVIAAKGSTAVQQLKSGERGSLTTIIPAVNAAGDIMPPFIIFKGATVANAVREPLSAIRATVACTKSGYNDSETFLTFLGHFQQHRSKITGQKCLLVLDGHASHMSVEAAEFCDHHGIELVCLPPHTTHRIQPLDTHFNRVLKQEWTKALDGFLRESEKSFVGKTEFAQLFPDVWRKVDSRRGLIVDAFQHCGLFPLCNTVKDEEFAKSQPFISGTVFDQTKKPSLLVEDPSPLSSSSAQPSTSSSLPRSEMPSTSSFVHVASPGSRRSFPTPAKKANPTHFKPHTASLKVRLFAKKNSAPSCQNQPRKKDSGKAPVRSESRKAVVGKKSSQCGVCGELYVNSVDDWLKCPKCGSWVCETCYGSDMCANCE